MKKIIILFVYLSSSLAFCDENKEVLQNLILQNFFPAKGISFKWTNEITLQGKNEKYVREFFIALDLTSSPALKVVEYEKNGSELLRSYKDGILVYVSKFGTHMSGRMKRGTMGEIFPSILYSWISPTSSSDEMLVLNKETLKTFTISKINECIILSDGSYKFVFYPNSFDLHMMEYHTNKMKEGSVMLSRVTMSDYVKVGVYSFPLSIKGENFNKDGSLNSSGISRINQSSLYMGYINPGATKIVFIPGARIGDEINGKEIIVTDVSDLEKKEDIITSILEDNIEQSNKLKDNFIKK